MRHRAWVTGARDRVAEGAEAMIEADPGARRYRCARLSPVGQVTGLPLCRRDIVGSALVAFIAEASGAAGRFSR